AATRLDLIADITLAAGLAALAAVGTHFAAHGQHAYRPADAGAYTLVVVAAGALVRRGPAPGPGLGVGFAGAPALLPPPGPSGTRRARSGCRSSSPTSLPRLAGTGWPPRSPQQPGSASSPGSTTCSGTRDRPRPSSSAPWRRGCF